jgi:Na+/proline symporter
MGLLVVSYTAFGGNKAVTWSDVQQMLLISCSLVLALFMAIHLLPAHISWASALSLAGAAGRLNAVNTHFDWDDRYNIWSGVIGGMFLALAYFGCDQSQVQRYLTGKSIGQSRLGLLFNAMAKIPMQFFILFIGAMVFVFFNYERPPLLFQPVELKNVQKDARFPAAERRYQEAYAHRREAADRFLKANRSGDPGARTASIQRYRDAQQELNDAHAAGERLVGKEFDDTNFIFLSFVTHYLPVGVVGLIVAVIFSAAMSSTSGEINSLSAVTVIDIYRRHIKRDASDRHYLIASRIATVFWGCFAMGFAQYGKNFGALIQAVNVIGSLFYGGLLGVFVLAFFFRSVGANGAFFGVLAGEAAIFAANLFTHVSFLWYNVIGCLVVILVGVAVSRLFDRGSAQSQAADKKRR